MAHDLSVFLNGMSLLIHKDTGINIKHKKIDAIYILSSKPLSVWTLVSLFFFDWISLDYFKNTVLQTFSCILRSFRSAESNKCRKKNPKGPNNHVSTDMGKIWQCASDIHLHEMCICLMLKIRLCCAHFIDEIKMLHIYEKMCLPFMMSLIHNIDHNLLITLFL